MREAPAGDMADRRPRRRRWPGRKAGNAMIYAYTRQTPGGPGTRERLESQTEALKRESPDRLVIEKIPKGKRKKMDDFWDLFRVMKRGDTLVIPSVDRVSHSASDFSGLIKGLRNKGVTVKVLNIGVLDDSPEGRARLQTIEAFGEFEKAMVVERTQGEKSRARSDAAYQEGRPRKYSWKELNAALRLLETNSYRKVVKMTGISLSTLQRAKRAEDAKKRGDYTMTDADTREYEAAVANAQQMSLEDLL